MPDTETPGGGVGQEGHHGDALLETARAELDRAHAAALAMNAAELRRGLELALAAVRDAGAGSSGLPDGAAGRLERALAELDDGQLVAMEKHIEEVRTLLNR